ncbi:hypothetical protein CCR85_06725 [Rhodothalassium salexigens]|uniref:Uncharacterized protein n=1 Tax=Rhodothalassium salexigens DSM 2132 TaxID=1188247 RepID=A0A4R2PHN3_RHOSA|nr:hypothetical protein [Rhodothalassium salexigens]MBB4211961.1 hypothetical protein [Rhodothalassium salexigens DSM 2132]MBK1638623.1 hypothetical protein [Rhodothalassium salexigens DSM 2132]MBK5911185.1 hypothetical protein [Rhodothalassium salexigens]MBK5921925.1 hypothetical protein [Rhodothalassium salexigens]TCP33455.1 hypothetical protein EV659_10765 [Rhodothalassium salexigens DSM 2132]
MDITYGLTAGTLGALLVGASMERGLAPGDGLLAGGLGGLVEPEGSERVIRLSAGGVRVVGPLVLG